MAKFGEAMRGLTVFISDIRNCTDVVYLCALCAWVCMCVLVNASSALHLWFVLHLGKSKEAERKRINKELANIRSKFKSKYLQCT